MTDLWRGHWDVHPERQWALVHPRSQPALSPPSASVRKRTQWRPKPRLVFVTHGYKIIPTFNLPDRILERSTQAEAGKGRSL